MSANPSETPSLPQPVRLDSEGIHQEPTPGENMGEQEGKGKNWPIALLARSNHRDRIY